MFRSSKKTDVGEKHNVVCFVRQMELQFSRLGLIAYNHGNLFPENVCIQVGELFQ